MQFSVIIPTFNSVEFVEQTICSVLVGNESVEMEILVLDDGSADNTVRLIKDSFSDDRIKIYSLPHMGPANVKNYGLQIAQGKYIIFVDSDDIISPDFFKVISMEIIKNSPDMIIFNYGEFRNNTEDAAIRRSDRKRLDSIGTMIWNKVYASRILKKLDFPKDTVYEDALFSVEAKIRSVDVVTVSNVLYFYRQRTDSLTKKINIPPCQHLDILQDFTEFFKNLKRDNIVLTLSQKRELSVLFNKLMLDHVKKIITLDASKEAKKTVIRKFILFKDDKVKKNLEVDYFDFGATKNVEKKFEYLLLKINAFYFFEIVAKIRKWRN